VGETLSTRTARLAEAPPPQPSKRELRSSRPPQAGEGAHFRCCYTLGLVSSRFSYPVRMIWYARCSCARQKSAREKLRRQANPARRPGRARRPPSFCSGGSLVRCPQSRQDARNSRHFREICLTASWCPSLYAEQLGGRRPIAITVPMKHR
jgi:hypothetical protein